MQDGFTYSVYSPTNPPQAIAPAMLRTAPPPQKTSLFGVGFVVLVILFIVGATFGAQRFIDMKLAARPTMSLGAPVTAPSAPAETYAAPPPPAAPAEAIVVSTDSVASPAEVAGPSPAPVSKHRRKLRHRRSPAAAASAAPSPPSTAATEAMDEALPPNPF